jgi:hypothetical protein
LVHASPEAMTRVDRGLALAGHDRAPSGMIYS